MPHRALLTAAFLALVVAFPVGATDCTDGMVYDDGVFDDGYVVQTSIFPSQLAMRFDPAGLPVELEEVCLCWFREGNHSRVDFDLKMWNADGPSGAPGSLVRSVAGLTAIGLDTTPQFYSYDLRGLGIEVSQPVYIGVSWLPGANERVYLCADESPSTSLQPAYGGIASTVDAVPSQALGTASFFPAYRALGIRAELDDSSSTCFEDSNTLCVNNGRFRVEVDWTTLDGTSGDGMKVRLTDDSGYFWFFNASNVELVVKLLDACMPPFERFWFFAAGLTNVRVEIHVTDTATGAMRTYTNLQGQAFEPIQDTNAFSTCP